MSAIKILAIESSCDETSAAVIIDGKIMSNIICTQAIHEKYGGVIPESASRLHIKNIMPVVLEAMEKSNTTKPELSAIAYTQSPGLIGSLLVGSCFAKSMAQALSIPTIAVNHMQAHVLSNLIESPTPNFPFLCLTVSGGHTQIVVCHSPLEQEIIGSTIDDAAGEAFDKSAKMLGLPYPGGPLIDKYAQLGNPIKFKFAEPNIKNLDYSFSGLKTSILYFLQKQKKENPQFIEENLNDLCASIQHTIIKILMKKLILASKQTNIKEVCIAGGVSANSGLRKALKENAITQSWKTYIPKFEYCTDNAAMIAITAYYKFLKNEFADLQTTASARSL
ncbi:MAG TPA: tRNA (adenosine(37)-N6)-threonylcarbamoyltransferase complex transferase subunit TsaD [Chitinophagaceae bacterium]|nr:MAG: glycoprotease family metalloendopeptidase [Bacteroidetes bacterium OLB11]HMN32281.1 tRNA (adenosine(37)-N6)-threonylcarbamoyltransferase complex transferase subunit TsaD [Chitinophagaceae bacterium]